MVVSFHVHFRTSVSGFLFIEDEKKTRQRESKRRSPVNGHVDAANAWLCKVLSVMFVTSRIQQPTTQDMMSTKGDRFKVLRSTTRYIPLSHSIPSCFIHHTVHSDTHPSILVFIQLMSTAWKAQRFPGCALASSRSSSSLGLSITGVGGLCADTV